MKSDINLNNYWWIFNYLLLKQKYETFTHKNVYYHFDINKNFAGNLNAVEIKIDIILDKLFNEKLNKFLFQNNINHIGFNVIKNNQNLTFNNYETDLLSSYGFKINKLEKIILFLKKDTKILFSNLRKSYKSIINYNKKICEIKNSYLLNFDEVQSMINDWLNLYGKKINKKINIETKSCFKKSIFNKEIILICAYFKGEYLGGVVFNINKNKATYSLSANINNINLKSSTAGHIMIWEAISFLSLNNIDFIDFGEILNFNSNLNYNKELLKIKNIEKFKLGFGGEFCEAYKLSKFI
jgi:hypothetical protein